MARLPQSAGKLAIGTQWETNYYVVDSGETGPTVLIVGGMHGNEPAGSRAAQQIRHWPLVKGRLVVIPRANVPGLNSNNRYIPNQTKETRDLNRNFPQIENSEQQWQAQPRGELAAALWRFAMKCKPDWVIDLHEGYEFNISHKPPRGKKKSVGSSVIYKESNRMNSLIKQVIASANSTVTDSNKIFNPISSGPVKTGLARACINVIGAEAVILETTYKNQPLSLRTRQHRMMVNVLLNHIGLINHDCSNYLAGPKSTNYIRVGLYDGVGAGTSHIDLADVIIDHPNQVLTHLGPRDMRPQILQQFDVLAFPGGSGSKQAKAIGEDRLESVRSYVENGGGVIGVCAGAYLCSAQYPWSLKLIDSSVFTGSVEIPAKGKKQLWYRGKETDIELELTKEGQLLFQSEGIENSFVVKYANGPIQSPKGLSAIDDYKVLAWFRSENGLWEPQKGTMINTPAIVSGSYGSGRIMSISPHPEKTKGLFPIITKSIEWVAQNQVSQ